MLPKPPACAGCSMYGDGMGFCPDRIVPDCRVALVAQAPGRDEEQGQRIVGWAGLRQPIYEPCQPQPLVGQTGHDVRMVFLPRTGLTADDVSMLNVLKCRWTLPNGRKTNDLPTGRVLEDAVAHCMKHYFQVPDSTHLIVAMGSLAWKVLGGSGSITEWRGFLKPAG